MSLLNSIGTWLKDNNVGGSWADAASLAGFLLTLFAAGRARRAAVAAKKAAEKTRDSIRLLESLVDFQAAISTLEEIKRLHRQRDAWPLLPERYAAIRKHLILLRGSGVKLTDTQETIIQNALANLYTMEKQVEKSLTENSSLRGDRFNALVSTDIDALLGVLQKLKSGGG